MKDNHKKFSVILGSLGMPIPTLVSELLYTIAVNIHAGNKTGMDDIMKWNAHLEKIRVDEVSLLIKGTVFDEKLSHDEKLTKISELLVTGDTAIVNQFLPKDEEKAEQDTETKPDPKPDSTEG